MTIETAKLPYSKINKTQDKSLQDVYLKLMMYMPILEGILSAMKNKRKSIDLDTLMSKSKLRQSLCPGSICV